MKLGRFLFALVAVSTLMGTSFADYVCPTELDAAVNCIPSLACADCLGNAESSILSGDVSCYSYILGMCSAILVTCPYVCGEGCEAPLELYYSCLLEYYSGGVCTGGYGFDCELKAPNTDTSPTFNSTETNGSDSLSDKVASTSNAKDAFGQTIAVLVIVVGLHLASLVLAN